MLSSFLQWISDNRLFVAICTVFLGTIAFFLAIDARGVESRPAFDRQIEAEVAQESRIACEKWGLEASTAAHVACVANLAAIRANHDSRRRTDDFGF
jgi:hypothetical protein